MLDFADKQKDEVDVSEGKRGPGVTAELHRKEGCAFLAPSLVPSGKNIG